MHWFCSFFKAFLWLIAPLFKEFAIIPNKDVEALKIQAPAINPLVNTESTIEKEVVNEDRIKCEELASHFEYLSTMSSFKDPAFKNIAKNLLKDRHASWSTFKSLSPKLV